MSAFREPGDRHHDGQVTARGALLIVCMSASLTAALALVGYVMGFAVASIGTVVGGRHRQRNREALDDLRLAFDERSLGEIDEHLEQVLRLEQRRCRQRTSHRS